MPNQPTSFRFPFNLDGKAHEHVVSALRYSFNGLKDLNDAIKKLNTKVNANTGSITNITNVAATASSGVTPTPTPPLFLSIAVTIPSASVLALKALPIQLLVAPGAGSMYAPCLIVLQYKFATTPYTVNASGNQYLCIYDGTQPTLANLGNAFALINATGFVDQGASQVWVAPALGRNSQLGFDNQPLSIGLPSDCSAELLAGDGTLTVTVEYAVVTLI